MIVRRGKNREALPDRQRFVREQPFRPNPFDRGLLPIRFSE
jgi:hypothetical protein